jgi:hypothetical protein
MNGEIKWREFARTAQKTDEDEEDRTEIALMKRLTSTVVALGSQAVVSFAHRQINWVGVAVEGRVGGGYKA